MMSETLNQTELLSATAIAEMAIPLGPSKANSGIYFLLRQERIVYVGQTVQHAIQRVTQHKDKEFDSWHWVPCPIESLAEIERAYIAALKPTLNKQLNLVNGRPLTGAERQARQRTKAEERRRLAEEAIQFVLSLHPDRAPPRAALEALQQRLRDVFTEHASNAITEREMTA